jgi:glycosyltransferase involved in cell wall biosynthesis
MKKLTKTKKIIVGIDGNEANLQSRVGINVYAHELLKNLALLQEEWKNEFDLIVYLKNKPLPDMPKETKNFSYKVLGGGGKWILTKLMPYLLTIDKKPDIFFSPSHYVPPFATMPRICSIMDLGYLEFSGQFKKFDFWQLKAWSAISIYISKAIISISQKTKDDIVRHYPISKNKIYVTPLGFDSGKFTTAIDMNDVRRVKNKYSIVSNYVLFLGTLKPSKNIEGVIEAFYFLKNKMKVSVSERAQLKDLKLVIGGKKGWLYDSIYNKVTELGISDSVIFTDYVDEKDKPGLIRGAKVFVIPSHWEGFGLDALSAMAAGIPVVASRTGSLPEVVGSAGVLVDPKNPESIAEGMKEVILGGQKKYNRLQALGLMHVKDFSWKETARGTLEVFRKVAQGK